MKENTGKRDREKLFERRRKMNAEKQRNRDTQRKIFMDGKGKSEG